MSAVSYIETYSSITKIRLIPLKHNPTRCIILHNQNRKKPHLSNTAKCTMMLNGYDENVLAPIRLIFRRRMTFDDS